MKQLMAQALNKKEVLMKWLKLQALKKELVQVSQRMVKEWLRLAASASDTAVPIFLFS